MAGITITRGPAKDKGKKAKAPQIAWRDVPRAMAQQGALAKQANLRRFLAAQAKKRAEGQDA